MFKIYKKRYLCALVALSFLGLFNSSLRADECCPSSECNRLYIGGFGGGIFSNSTELTQAGTVFFTEANGGPLAINARGDSEKKWSGFGGVQIGYEWSQCPINIGYSNWSVVPAAELEAYFYHQNKKGHLLSPSERLVEQDFLDTFPMNVGVYLFNGMFSFNNCCWGRISPYVGGGVGFARICITHANSLQVSPEEGGINHFNADRSDFDWTFAAQVKAGLRYQLCGRFHLFGEYRFSYVDSSRYVFGSAVYPTHPSTSPWNVNMGRTCNNAFAIGLQFDLNP